MINDKGQYIKGFSASPGTQFKKGEHWRDHQPFREREWLIYEYVDKQRSSKEIAEDFGVTDAAILFWLRKHKIPRRTTSAARSVKHWGSTGPSNPMFGRNGDKNPNYRGGSSPDRQRLYSGHEWKSLVKRIYARDGYKCRRCGLPKSHKRKLHAHHIKLWSQYPELRFEDTNLVTLCKGCHDYVHSKQNTSGEFLS